MNIFIACLEDNMNFVYFLVVNNKYSQYVVGNIVFRVTMPDLGPITFE